ncbi:MAG: L-2-amino-thiazoline-4-carboxylic acid hydrolase [Candidatus Odinarchaeota archaeon]
MVSKIAKNNNTDKEYYIKNKKNIMKQFNSSFKVVEKAVLPIYSDVDVDRIEKEARFEFESLLSKLPYVGGDKSPFTPLMLQSAQTIAFYKASKALNLAERIIGKLIYEVAESYTQSISPFKKWFFRKSMFSKKMKNFWREWLNESQKQQYPENWVGEFIEGDNENFDWGFNFNECGCLKLLQKEDAEEIAPYICLCDYARMRALGVGFKRTRTIISGAEICDFRFIKNYQTQRGWPPENLDETKNYKI